MKMFYYILHSFKECPDKDLIYFKDVMTTCKKCGRVHFIFNN